MKKYLTSPKLTVSLIALAALTLISAPLRAEDDHHAYDDARANAQRHHASQDSRHAREAAQRALHSGSYRALAHAIKDARHAHSQSHKSQAARAHANRGHGYSHGSGGYRQGNSSGHSSSHSDRH